MDDEFSQTQSPRLEFLLNDTDPHRIRLTLERRNLEELETNPRIHTVSVGTEVEVHVTPKWLENKSKQSQSALYSNISNRLNIPGNKTDGIWEFSFLPANNYETLTREIQFLYDYNYLDRKHRTYPLHITVGGLTVTDEAYLYYTALISSAYASDANRLRQSGPYLKGENGLVVKSDDLEKPNNLSDPLNAQTAIEMRLFRLRSQEGYARILRSAFLIGSALKAFQLQRTDTTSRRLKTVFLDFKNDFSDLLNEYLVPQTLIHFDHLSNFEAPNLLSISTLMSDSWKSMQQGRNDTFVNKTREIITTTNARVSSILGI